MGAGGRLRSRRRWRLRHGVNTHVPLSLLRGQSQQSFSAAPSLGVPRLRNSNNSSSSSSSFFVVVKVANVARACSASACSFCRAPLRRRLAAYKRQTRESKRSSSAAASPGDLGGGVGDSPVLGLVMASPHRSRRRQLRRAGVVPGDRRGAVSSGPIQRHLDEAKLDQSLASDPTWRRCAATAPDTADCAAVVLLRK